jgi:formate-dependent nitrite reductase membrane component NrfD
MLFKIFLGLGAINLGVLFLLRKLNKPNYYWIPGILSMLFIVFSWLAAGLGW